MISPMKIETALPTHFERLVAIWESSVRATHHFLQESDIAALRPLLLNAYLPNLKVVIARDDAGVIHGFLGVDENRIEMLFVDDASRGKGVGKLLLQHAIAAFGANEVDVNEQNPQGVEFYRHMGFEQVGRSEGRARESVSVVTYAVGWAGLTPSPSGEGVCKLVTGNLPDDYATHFFPIKVIRDRITLDESILYWRLLIKKHRFLFGDLFLAEQCN